MTNGYSQPRTGIIISGFVLTLILMAISSLSAEAAVLTTHMDMGERSSDVTALQTFLAKNPNNYPSGLVTGYFGTSTAEGVQKCQTNQGIVTEGTPESTGYGRVGPRTMSRLNDFMMQEITYQTGPVGDVYAPQITKEYLRETPSAVTIGWSTSELAMSEVMYGTVWPFQYATAKSVETSAYTVSPEVELKNLATKTRYYYVLKSVDVYGNIMLTTHRTFTNN